MLDRVGASMSGDYAFKVLGNRLKSVEDTLRRILKTMFADQFVLSTKPNTPVEYTVSSNGITTAKFNSIAPSNVVNVEFYGVYKTSTANALPAVTLKYNGTNVASKAVQSYNPNGRCYINVCFNHVQTVAAAGALYELSVSVPGLVTDSGNYYFMRAVEQNFVNTSAISADSARYAGHLYA